MLKIGGIYTEIEDEYIYVIIKYSKVQNRYLVCQLKDMCFRSNVEIIEFLSRREWRRLHKNAKDLSYIHISKETLSADIDGYLGQIDDELLKQLEGELHHQHWYNYVLW